MALIKGPSGEAGLAGSWRGGRAMERREGGGARTSEVEGEKRGS